MAGEAFVRFWHFADMLNAALRREADVAVP
jgi:hypothetical protein